MRVIDLKTGSIDWWSNPTFMTSELKGHMLGPAGCRSSQSSHSQQLVKVALPPLYPSSPRAHSFKLVTRAPATASLRRTHKSLHHQDVVSLPPNQETSCGGHHITSMTSFHNHASSCILAADGKVGATIWHALLPARHLAPLEWDANLPSIRALRPGIVDPVAGMMIQSSDSTSVSTLI